MLEELRIRNFAIIDTLELDFASGFNVITGETGAGKSITIDALELLIGGRADAGAIRAGADRAVIEGIFTLDPRTRAQIIPILEQADLLDGESVDAVILSREVRKTGRSASRINGVTVSLDLLRKVGDVLVDIHGQSAHLSLLNPRSHMDLLDRYADLLDIRSALATVVQSLNELRAETKRLTADKDALEKRAEMLRYEVEEIQAAELNPDEEAEITSELKRLGNSEQLATIALEASVLLAGDENSEQISALDALMQVANLMEKLSSIDEGMKDDHALADTISEQAQELALTLGGYADDVEYDPQRLNELEERLELIRTLKRRYKCETIADIINYGEKASTELASIEHSDERLEELRAKEEQYLRHIGELSKTISNDREIAGKKLAKMVVQELKDLRMENTQFEVQMTQTESEEGCYIGEKRFAFDSTGVDKLEFMMSANPGQPMRPVSKVASGGESARIMLALKRVLSEADQTPILIFDEIDQGIGGRIGAIVGEKLWSLSKSHQVLVVTHLPQLATFGDVHYRVQKSAAKKSTSTEMLLLNTDEELVAEIAEMLGATGESGRKSAFDLLQEARKRKM